MNLGEMQKEVLRFVCGLTTEPHLLIEDVCCRLAFEFSQVKFKDLIDDRLVAYYRLLESMCKELLPESNKNDAPHKHIAYSGENYTLMLTPSRLFEMFVCYAGSTQAVKCAVIENNAQNVDPIELRKLLQKSSDEEVIVSSLYLVGDDHNDDASRFMFESFQCSKNTTRVIMQNCNFMRPPQSCEELDLLHLENVQNISHEFNEIIDKYSRHLTWLRIEKCTIDPNMLPGILTNLRYIDDLELLSFKGTKVLPGGTCDYSLPLSLEELNVSHCDMSADSCGRLLQVSLLLRNLLNI